MSQPPLVDFLTADAFEDDAGHRWWVLTFPAPAPITSVNRRDHHWAVGAEQRRLWREAVYTYVRQARLPTGLTKVRIDIQLCFPTGARRDEANYHPTVAKPIVDALGPGRAYRSRAARTGTVSEVGYGLIPDDTPAHLDGPYITFGPPIGRNKGYGRVTITITELTGAAM
jgi:hypothetical protein